jgi:hypothetical protein
MPTDRITVTLPRELVIELARVAQNRSRFVAVAIRRELDRRRHEALKASLEKPHPETVMMAETGFAEWAAGASGADADLLDPRGGTAVQWSPEKGWVKVDEPRARRRRPRRS